jgi:hypothetical protein
MWCVLNSASYRRPFPLNSSPNQLFNRILAPYVENLDFNQVNYGIGQGMSDQDPLQTPYLISHRPVDASKSAFEKGRIGQIQIACRCPRR